MYHAPGGFACPFGRMRTPFSEGCEPPLREMCTRSSEGCQPLFKGMCAPFQRYLYPLSEGCLPPLMGCVPLFKGMCAPFQKDVRHFPKGYVPRSRGCVAGLVRILHVMGWSAPWGEPKLPRGVGGATGRWCEMRANACQVEYMATSASAVRPSASPFFLTLDFILQNMVPHPTRCQLGQVDILLPSWSGQLRPWIRHHMWHSYHPGTTHVAGQ